jgi:hypothetical protein
MPQSLCLKTQGRIPALGTYRNASAIEFGIQWFSVLPSFTQARSECLDLIVTFRFVS